MASLVAPHAKRPIPWNDQPPAKRFRGNGYVAYGAPARPRSGDYEANYPSAPHYVAQPAGPPSVPYYDPHRGGYPMVSPVYAPHEEMQLPPLQHFLQATGAPGFASQTGSGTPDMAPAPSPSSTVATPPTEGRVWGWTLPPGLPHAASMQQEAARAGAAEPRVVRTNSGIAPASGRRYVSASPLMSAQGKRPASAAPEVSAAAKWTEFSSDWPSNSSRKDMYEDISKLRQVIPGCDDPSKRISWQKVLRTAARYVCELQTTVNELAATVAAREEDHNLLTTTTSVLRGHIDQIQAATAHGGSGTLPAAYRRSGGDTASGIGSSFDIARVAYRQFEELAVFTAVEWLNTPMDALIAAGYAVDDTGGGAEQAVGMPTASEVRERVSVDLFLDKVNAARGRMELWRLFRYELQVMADVAHRMPMFIDAVVSSDPRGNAEQHM